MIIVIDRCGSINQISFQKTIPRIGRRARPEIETRDPFVIVVSVVAVMVMIGRDAFEAGIQDCPQEAFDM